MAPVLQPPTLDGDTGLSDGSSSDTIFAQALALRRRSNADPPGTFLLAVSIVLVALNIILLICFLCFLPRRGKRGERGP